MIELSQRLEKLIEVVPSGKTIVDVGTDHALVPIRLLQKGISPKAIATDINRGPYESALSQVKNHMLHKEIDVRLGDGLTPLKPGEAQVAIIAGMGGVTIAEILENASQVVSGIDTLIIQPMRAADAVRRWLCKHQWQLSSENLVKEGDKFYQIIVANKSDKSVEWPEMINDYYWEMGPLLIQQGHELLIEKININIIELKKVKLKVESIDSKKAKERLRELGTKIEQLKELKKVCLQNASK